MALLNVRVLSAAFIAVALGVSASKAEGQQGRFTLPFDAQWGSLALKAGDYTLSTPASTSWPQVISLSGSGKTFYILAGNEAITPQSERSYLRIVNVNGNHFVREYSSGIKGKSFTFDAPKAIRAQMAAEKTAETDIAVMIRH